MKCRGCKECRCLYDRGFGWRRFIFKRCEPCRGNKWRPILWRLTHQPRFHDNLTTKELLGVFGEGNDRIESFEQLVLRVFPGSEVIRGGDDNVG